MKIIGQYLAEVLMTAVIAFGCSYFTNSAEADEEQISVTIDFYNMLQLCLIGITVIILSVGISSLSVMRLRPREILFDGGNVTKLSGGRNHRHIEKKRT